MESMLNKLIKYSVIRFVPYAQREEFVNVGVVAYFPQTGDFHYRLLPIKQSARVNQFFPLLKDSPLFAQAMALLAQELKRIQNYSKYKQSNTTFFDTLTAPKDGVLQFGKAQVELVAQYAALTEEVDRIFNELVSFEAERYKSPQHEKELTRWFKQTYLNAQGIQQRFKMEKLQEQSLGIKITLPFYAKESGKSIKPLSFEGYSDAMQINNHAMKWLANVMRASRAGMLDTKKHLIVYQMPEQPELAQAADFALDMLSSTKTVLCEAKAQTRIEAFISL